MKLKSILLAGLWGIVASLCDLQAETAFEIVRRADQLVRADSSIAEMSMTVQKPDWSRTIRMKAWALEPDFSLVLITEPARDKGTVTLKRFKEVWNYIPTIQKVIKIPPSMMLQSWMGSDFTNDDLVRESSMVTDYEHRLLGETVLDGHDCHQIEMIPKPEAGVVWGKIVIWITKTGYLQLRSDFYDEDGTLVKHMIGREIKELGGRTFPTHIEMIPDDKPGQKTTIDYHHIQFNPRIDPVFFSEQNMKRVR